VAHSRSTGHSSTSHVTPRGAWRAGSAGPHDFPRRIATAGAGLFVLAVLALAGCAPGAFSDDNDDRTIFVEVSSSPSGVVAHVSVGNDPTADFEAPTPDARNVSAGSECDSLRTRCDLFGTASAANATSLTLCLTDFGRRRCSTSSTGFVIVNATVDTD
jgi:hypothetical protein